MRYSACSYSRLNCSRNMLLSSSFRKFSRSIFTIKILSRRNSHYIFLRIKKKTCYQVLFKRALSKCILPARFQNLRLRTGTSTSPERGRLPLLSSDPGGVHGLSPCGTHPSMLQELAVTAKSTQDKARNRKGRDSNPR